MPAAYLFPRLEQTCHRSFENILGQKSCTPQPSGEKRVGEMLYTLGVGHFAQGGLHPAR